MLYQAGRYDGAIYLCGYAVEIALKAKICETLGGNGFPESNREFQSYRSFKTHDLDVLLSLSGSEPYIKARYFTKWAAVATWDPQMRYNFTGSATEQDAESMLNAAQTLLDLL